MLWHGLLIEPMDVTFFLMITFGTWGFSKCSIVFVLRAKALVLLGLDSDPVLSDDWYFSYRLESSVHAFYLYLVEIDKSVVRARKVNT